MMGRRALCPMTKNTCVLSQKLVEIFISVPSPLTLALSPEKGGEGRVRGTISFKS
jgi:hypothetical protein